MPRRIVLALVLALVASCSGPRQPIPLTPDPEHSTAPVLRRELPPVESPGVMAPPSALPPVLVAPAIAVPADAVYVCVVDRGGERTTTVIQFAPKVLTLCRRHPEMGPCQYERNVCRGAGGRVYAANGQEITLRTEADYDRKVMRVRFQAN